MACASCGTSKDGKPSGCQSNGGCSTGGCNRMNVYDWLSDLPFSSQNSRFKVVEVSFKQGSRKGFFRNLTNIDCDTGDTVVVESTTGGYDIGRISLSGELVRLQMRKRRVTEDAELPRLIRIANDRDRSRRKESRALEYNTMIMARVIARQLNLNMKIGDVEYQGDGRKATFYYIADERVDFRELIKLYAREFSVKIEMRQIGARQEAGRIGGIGSCGRELCCSTWLTDFKSVSTAAARYQNLAINQAKLSGQCGRLKCCLNYELSTYLDALQDFPRNADILQTAQGEARLIKTDIFKRKLWYSLPKNSMLFPISVEQVKEIQEMNAKGEQPDSLLAMVDFGKSTEADMSFEDGVGETTLGALEESAKRKKNRERRLRRKKKKMELGNEDKTNKQQKNKSKVPTNPNVKQKQKPKNKPKADANKDKTKPNSKKTSSGNKPPSNRGGDKARNKNTNTKKDKNPNLNKQQGNKQNKKGKPIDKKGGEKKPPATNKNLKQTPENKDPKKTNRPNKNKHRRNNNKNRGPKGGGDNKGNDNTPPKRN